MSWHPISLVAMSALAVLVGCGAVLPDEASLGESLPDPLVLESGVTVRDAETWRQVRRPEILSSCSRRTCTAAALARAPMDGTR